MNSKLLFQPPKEHMTLSIFSASKFSLILLIVCWKYSLKLSSCSSSLCDWDGVSYIWCGVFIYDSEKSLLVITKIFYFCFEVIQLSFYYHFIYIIFGFDIFPTSSHLSFWPVVPWFYLCTKGLQGGRWQLLVYTVAYLFTICERVSLYWSINSSSVPTGLLMRSVTSRSKINCSFAFSFILAESYSVLAEQVSSY